MKGIFDPFLKTFRMSDKAVDTAKYYKALISQNAPVANTTDPSMVAGQIWTLNAYNAADAATIAALELVSGTLNAVGSKYRSATDQTLAVNVATTLSYDGSPYVVSTNAAGAFAPFVNTIGNIVLSYNTTGNFSLTLSGAFPQQKTRLPAPNQRNPTLGLSYIIAVWNSTNDVVLQSYNSLVAVENDILYYTPITIKVYE